MPEKISVVIICKNVESTIAKAIGSALAITDDVVVADTGSTDSTVEIIKETKAKLYQFDWIGYGASKNKANLLAKNDWIFSLDADEVIDETLAESLRKVDLEDETVTGVVKRLSYIGPKPIRHGEWGNDKVVRLFNRKNAEWDVSPVHERLIQKRVGKAVTLRGVIHHFTAETVLSQKLKMEKYARLMAEKYFDKGKEAAWYKPYLSPAVSFLVNYLGKAGFLDGKEGFQLALANAWYTSRKYELLKQRQSKG